MKLGYRYCQARTIPTEANDCVVRSIAIACKLSYETAHRICFNAGREARKGASAFICLEETPVRFETIESRTLHKPDVQGINYGSNNQYYPTLATIAPLLSHGRFIVTTRQHAFPVIDGIQYDTAENRARVRIVRIYEINL